MDEHVKIAGTWGVAGVVGVLALLGLGLLLAGCGLTPQGAAVREAVKARGAEVMDRGLADAEWFMCHAASIGSVRRRFGRPGLAEAYRELCEGTARDLIAPAGQGGPGRAGALESEGRNGESDQ